MTPEGPEGPLGFDDGHPEPELVSQPSRSSIPPPVPSTARYTWFVGIVAVIVLLYIGLNTLNNNGPGSRGVAVGRLVPPFAAPLATGDLKGDVNVATPKTAGDAHKAGKVPACTIHSSSVLTVCDAYAKTPLVIAFFASRGGGCVSELDDIAVVAARHPRVNVAAIAIRGKRDDIRKLVGKHGWTFPVAYDQDGILANLYGVAVCPEITYVRRGGRVAGTTLGAISKADLEAHFAALQAGRLLPPKN
jgi:peroxiredoxin